METALLAHVDAKQCRLHAQAVPAQEVDAKRTSESKQSTLMPDLHVRGRDGGWELKVPVKCQAPELHVRHSSGQNPRGQPQPPPRDPKSGFPPHFSLFF
jgi:hypothetical protein